MDVYRKLTAQIGKQALLLFAVVAISECRAADLRQDMKNDCDKGLISNYEAGSIGLPERLKPMLDRLVGDLKKVKLEVIIVTGRASIDEAATEVERKAIAEHRALLVKAFLTGAGIDPSRIFTEGKGSLISDNQSEGDKKCRPINRSVEIEIIGASLN